MIRAVFFDYDGVLTRDKTGSLTTNRFLSARTGIPFDRVRQALEKHNRALNDGQASYADVWPVVCADLERDVPLDLVVAAFESTPLNDAMFSLARGLKARYFVGIITDNKKERIDHLKQYQRLSELFDPIVVSAEVRCTKMNPRIFDLALARLRVDPEDSVFIDNSQDNLVAPAALGMKTVHFDDEKNDVAGLARLLDLDYGVSAIDSSPTAVRRRH